MGRIIEVDGELITQAIAAMGAGTEREVVEESLRTFIRMRRKGVALRELWGLVPDWEGDLDAMRRGR